MKALLLFIQQVEKVYISTESKGLLLQYIPQQSSGPPIGSFRLS
jgi:hypothetical protein